MMQDLVRILRDGELDRETKLRIIEIVSVSQDDNLVKELIEVLKQWDTADNAMEDDIKKSLADVEEKYKIEIAQIEETSGKNIERIEDDISKEDDISDIKKSILEN